MAKLLVSASRTKSFSRDCSKFRKMMVKIYDMGMFVPDGFSCIDTVVAILSDCCDTLVLIEWKSEWWWWSSRENELNLFA